MLLQDCRANKEVIVRAQVRIRQGRHFAGGVNRTVRSTIYPSVGDIIEEDEEYTNTEEETSARDTLFKWVVNEKQRQADEQQNRENVIVTSGGLIFLAIAALLVTASFLMSPLIENILSKF